MMFITKCLKCLSVVAVPYIKHNSLLRSLVPRSLKCIDPNCNGKVVEISKDELVNGPEYSVTTLSDEDYVRLLTQPKYNANPQKVGKLLLGKKVVSVELSAVGEGNRSIVHSLTLEGGISLYFGISSQGACVYKIEEPNEKDRSVSVETDISNCTEDRAQTGHLDSSEQGCPGSESDDWSGRPDIKSTNSLSAGDTRG